MTISIVLPNTELYNCRCTVIAVIHEHLTQRTPDISRSRSSEDTKYAPYPTRWGEAWVFPVSSETILLSFCVQILIHHYIDAIISVMVSYSDSVMFGRDISRVSGNTISTLFSGYNLKSKTVSHNNKLCLFIYPYFSPPIYICNMAYLTHLPFDK